MGDAHGIKLVSLSYVDLVKCMQSCIHDTVNRDLELVVNQYINKIHELMMDLEIQKEILKSANNMRAALAIQDNATAARESATMEFMENLSSTLCGGPVSKQNTFWWFKYGEFEICIEHNLYIRIKGDIKDTKSLRGNWRGDTYKWRYVELTEGKHLNFHTFEGQAGDWLDMDKREGFISKIALEIKSITTGIV